MKKYLIVFLAFLLIAVFTVVYAADATYGPKVYMKQGGDEQVIANGGTQTVESGGAIIVDSGGTLTVNGTTTVTGGTFSGSTLAGAFLSISSKVLSLADWYLSAADKLITFWTLISGSNGTNYMIACSDTEGRLRVIRNDTNGSVVIKEAGQTGVTIASGKTAVVIHNGTDYVRVSGDATH